MSYSYGQLVDRGTPTIRDAVHVAVVSVTAGMGLIPGQRIRVDTWDSNRSFVAYADADNGIGIVDPFLQAPIKQGDIFLLFLDPGTTKNLRHTWDHPDVPHPNEPDFNDYSYGDECRHCD